MAMFVNTAWLLEYLQPACSHEDVLSALPAAGLEIESLHDLNEKTTGETPIKLGKGPEYLVELNTLPNRPDFLGLIGIAREVAALLNIRLRMPAAPSSVPGKSPHVAVRILEPELCPRYLCGLVRGIKVGPSPAWLKARLQIAGIRPINNIVDVTNYVLYEFGQPLHSFDNQALRGGRIEVRRMAAGESMELLTGKVLSARGQDGKQFSQPPLVIADAERPVALAGIMGGLSTRTTEQTRDVLIEAACFDPVNIRSTVKEVDLGMEGRGTASSLRFERGTDPNLMLKAALDRALALIVEVAGGAFDGPVVDVYPSPRSPRVMRLSVERTNAYLALTLDAARIGELLGRLGMEVAPDVGANVLSVKVPTWRPHADDPVVLIEDVARLVGYGQIPTAPGSGEPSLGVRSPLDSVRQAVAVNLTSAGFYESRNPSLESPQMSHWLGTPGPIVTLANAQSAEMSVLRRSLLPGLVATVGNNIRRGAERANFFEMDRVFDPHGTAAPHDGPEGTDPTCRDQWRVAGIAGGRAQLSDWRGEQQTDFFSLKGVVEDLLDSVNCRERAFLPIDERPFVSGATAEVSSSGRRLGTLGQIDAETAGIDRLPFPLFAFELNLQPLTDAFFAAKSSRPLSRQPAVTRDMAIVAPTSIAYADLEPVVRQAAGGDLESLRLVDLYQGSQVARDHHSLTLRLVFRDPAKSLDSESVSTTVSRIVEALRDRFGAHLRE